MRLEFVFLSFVIGFSIVILHSGSSLGIDMQFFNPNFHFRLFQDSVEDYSFIPNITKYENITKIYTGSIDWINETLFYEEMSNISFENCPLCSHRYRGPAANSTPRDLVLSVCYNSLHRNILTFLRTLRSVGSRCTVVFLCTESFIQSFNQEELTAIRSCGAIIVNIKELKEIDWIFPISSRFAVAQLFLSKFNGAFDRVILADAFDTYFQMDPFQEQFGTKYAYATVEDDNLAYNHPNSDWLKRIDNNYWTILYINKKILCAGLIYGGMVPMLKFLDKFVDIEFWKTKTPHTLDQPLLNLMYYKHMLPKSFKIDKNAKNMVSASSWFFKKKPNSLGLMKIVMESNVPSAIHQYNRICQLNERVQEICPVLGPWHQYPYASLNKVKQTCSKKKR